jgi:hypothetical protein
MKKSAYDFGCITDRFIRTMIMDIVTTEIELVIGNNKTLLNAIPKLEKDIGGIVHSVRANIKSALQDPLEYQENFLEIKFCTSCGKPMQSGYSLMDEWFCSDECLHQKYTVNEWLAMYAGLDNTDPIECEKAGKMTQEELDEHSEMNDSTCYYTEWEWED